jgi:hypothetical protein
VTICSDFCHSRNVFYFSSNSKMEWSCSFALSVVSDGEGWFNEHEIQMVI